MKNINKNDVKLLIVDGSLKNELRKAISLNGLGKKYIY